MKRGLIIWGSLALLVLLGWSGFYTVNENERAVLMYFGRPEGGTIEPGFHLKWPIANTVEKYDRRLRVYQTNAITQTLQDKKTIILQAYLVWRIEDPLTFYESVRYVAVAEQKLNDIASSALGSSMSNFLMTSIVSPEKGGVKIPEIENSMKEQVNRRVRETYGMSVERFGVNRLALPETNERAVYDRMKSEREIAASDYMSQGRRDSDIIQAKARQAADETLAKAAAQATEIRGEGEAQAAQIYRDAYSKDPEFYKFWRTLEAYKKIIGSETTLIIPSDSELMKYFTMPSANPPAEKGSK